MSGEGAGDAGRMFSSLSNAGMFFFVSPAITRKLRAVWFPLVQELCIYYTMPLGDAEASLRLLFGLWGYLFDRSSALRKKCGVVIVVASWCSPWWRFWL